LKRGVELAQVPVVAGDLDDASVGFLDNLSTTRSRIYVRCVPHGVLVPVLVVVVVMVVAR
jgi:hypothetical protein